MGNYHCHKKDGCVQEKCPKKLRNQSEKIPAELIGRHFDAVLVYCDEDEKLARKVKNILQKVTLCDHRHAAVCTADDMVHVSSKAERTAEALRRSTYMCLLMTKSFVQDTLSMMIKDETLTASLEDPDKRWCLVPLHTKSKSERDFQYPFGLRALVGLDISKLLQDEKCSPEDRDDVIDRITRLLNFRHEYKIDREQKQAQQLMQWKKMHGIEGHGRTTMKQHERSEANGMEEQANNQVYSATLDQSSVYIDVRQPTQSSDKTQSVPSDQNHNLIMPSCHNPQMHTVAETDATLGVNTCIDVEAELEE